MRMMKARLARVSRTLPEGNLFRRLFANFSRVAGINEDMFARASFLEGILDLRPGTLSKVPRMSLQSFANDLEAGRDSTVISTLRDLYGMSSRDMALMFSARDLGMFDALTQGAARAMKGSGGFRGLEPEDISMSIAAGVSPLTGEAMKYGPGRNVFHYIAKNWKGRISLGGLARILQREAYNRALDVVRGTRAEDTFALPLDTPIGDEESSQALQDILVDQDPQFRSSYAGIIDAIFSDNGVLGVVDDLVRKKLTGPLQGFVWTAISNDPSLINVDGSGKVGVKSRELAHEVSSLSGVPFNPGGSSEVAAGKTFREKVWPAFLSAMDEAQVVKSLLRSRHVMEIVQEATRNQHYMYARQNVAARVAARHISAKDELVDALDSLLEFGFDPKNPASYDNNTAIEDTIEAYPRLKSFVHDAIHALEDGTLAVVNGKAKKGRGKKKASAHLFNDGQQILDRGVRTGIITIDEAENLRWQRAADDVADEWNSTWPEGEGFGSSDFTAVLEDLFHIVGVKTGYVGGRLKRLSPAKPNWIA